MRAAAIWEGIIFLDEHPEFARARALQVVMIALEIHGAWRCFKHLPSIGDTSRKGKAAGESNSSNSSGGSSKKRGAGSSGKSKAARVVSAAGSSPGGSPRSCVA